MALFPAVLSPTSTRVADDAGAAARTTPLGTTGARAGASLVQIINGVVEVGSSLYLHVVVLLLLLRLLLRLKPLVIRAVLSVLAVLGVEVVEGVRHDVPGVHRLPQRAGDALHGDVPPPCRVVGVHVGGDGEGKLH
jgi:hypothetical protein